MASNGQTNGQHAPSKLLLPGIHVPTPTFFEDTEEQEIDYKTQAEHHKFMIESGLQGIVIAGSTGEAVALTTAEKVRLVEETKKLAQSLKRPDCQVTLGVSGQCTRDVVAETIAAGKAGADFALVISPSYFAFGLTQKAIVSFYQEVADKSPIPVIIYNWPGVTNGIEINSDYVDILGQHPNIVAIKFTCGGIAKVARVADRFEHKQFMALAGQSDWLVPALASGAGGAISGMANFYPKTLMHLQELFLSGDKNQEARVLQGKVATAEWALGKSGINGIKALTVKALGYPAGSSKPRRPYEDFSGNEKLSGFLETVQSIKGIEASLNKKA